MVYELTENDMSLCQIIHKVQVDTKLRTFLDAKSLLQGRNPGIRTADGLEKEVLQLCSHFVLGSPDDAPGLFGARSIQVAAIRTGSHPACGRLVRALFALLP